MWLSNKNRRTGEHKPRLYFQSVPTMTLMSVSPPVGAGDDGRFGQAQRTSRSARARQLARIDQHERLGIDTICAADRTHGQVLRFQFLGGLPGQAIRARAIQHDDARRFRGQLRRFIPRSDRRC